MCHESTQNRPAPAKKALVVVQCFPPLLKNAGGVSKRYLTLCRALIDGLGWQVSLLTPVNVRCSKEPEVLRWLQAGSLSHLPARGVRASSSSDGVAVFLDLMSGVNAGKILRELCWRGDYDAVFTDDVPWRLELLLLARGMGVPSVVTTHTDITHMKSFKGTVKLVWQVHMLSTHLAAVHASVSRVFGEKMRELYNVPVGGIWPPILWSQEFRGEPASWAQEAQRQRGAWLGMLRQQGFEGEPRAILLNAGRWSAEKRIHLIFDVVPEDCVLIIVGDGTSEYADMVAKAGKECGRKNVLALRKMLNASELRLAYAASDLFLTASNFETLGNTVIEAWCSGTPVAIQPAQGHLEFVRDRVNSWFVDYDDQPEARAALERIVSAGLDPQSLAKAIPEFAPMGEKFRTSDFAKDFDKAIVAPALLAGQHMKERGLAELLIRFFCLLASCLLWFGLRAFTRIGFMIIRDPEFEVLGRLGGAVDDGQLQSVPTLPCLRPFFGAKVDAKENGRGDESAVPRSPKPSEEGTDYISHFDSARKPWWNRRL